MADPNGQHPFNTNNPFESTPKDNTTPAPQASPWAPGASGTQGAFDAAGQSQTPPQGAPGQPPTPPSGRAAYAHGTQAAPYAPVPGQNTSYNPARISGEPADLWLRIGARVVDIIIVRAVEFFPIFLLSSFLSIGQIFLTDLQNPNVDLAHPIPNWAIIVTVFISMIIRFINEVIMVASFGGTAGKLIFQLRLVDEQTKEKLTFQPAFKRFLVLYGPLAIGGLVPGFTNSDAAIVISVVALFWFIPLLISVVKSPPLQRGIHDRFAGSIVVNK